METIAGGVFRLVWFEVWFVQPGLSVSLFAQYIQVTAEKRASLRLIVSCGTLGSFFSVVCFVYHTCFSSLFLLTSTVSSHLFWHIVSILALSAPYSSYPLPRPPMENMDGSMSISHVDVYTLDSFDNLCRVACVPVSEIEIELPILRVAIFPIFWRSRSCFSFPDSRA